MGEERPLSPAAGLTVFRVVQEALTNARKHAGPSAAVDVRLRYTPYAVEVEIGDDGTGVAVSPGAAVGPPAAGAGLGLVGMRERVTALGGTLEVGPRTRGGWLVRATIPTLAEESGSTQPDRPEPAADRAATIRQDVVP